MTKPKIGDGVYCKHGYFSNICPICKLNQPKGEVEVKDE